MINRKDPYLAHVAKSALRSTAGAMSSVVMPPVRNFIVFTNGRTGSNLLINTLKKHPDVWIHSEIFGEYRLGDERMRNVINKRGPVKYYQDNLRRMKNEKVVGLKILYYQLENSYGEQWGAPGLEAVREAILADPTMKFIHLKRQDRISRLVSNRLSMATGQWEGGKYAVDRITIDIDWAREELARMEAWEDDTDAMLPPERTLQMTYEDLVADLNGGIEEVEEFLDITHMDLPDVQMRKQNTRPHSETIANFDELKAVFAGTPYAEQLG